MKPNASLKPAAIAAVVAAAFLAGILAGGGLLAERGAQPGPVAGQGAGTPQARPPAPAVTLTPATPGEGDPGASATRPGAAPAAPDAPPPFTEAPPIAPPPLSPEAQAEGERAAADAAASTPERPNGQVTHLVYDFESDEERQAWEAKQREGWARRLAREREIKLRIMREKVGLTEAQAPRFVEILEGEAQERQRLVDALAAGTIARSSFDEQVKQNVSRAREELARLLTPEQLAAYRELKPREQVLRDEAH